MVAIRILTLTMLFSALLAVEIVNKLVVTESEVELIVEKTKATTEFLVSIGPFGVYFLSVTVVKHIFEKVFVVKISEEDVGEVFYKNALNFGKEMGLEHAEYIAEDIANAAEKAFQNNISPLEYFRAVSDTLKRSLKKQGLLEQGNGKDLIDAYANSLENAANSENSMDPGAPVQALATGTADFLKSKGISSSKDVEFAGKAFANELRKQAGDDAHSAAGLISGRIEISYLLTFMIILKCIVFQKF
ncbi:uncharacterized protein [Parasteatoda tepidariorum]|uniref:uncharacterized protein isoform X2 n=1 Tax=Parasteatoda tepidariorum TaxID=114398 RepID=UPI001C71AD24|nr:uncharacterized protein LOC107443519 isoform X2 [Parasteatoda tepidariorum]